MWPGCVLLLLAVALARYVTGINLAAPTTLAVSLPPPGDSSGGSAEATAKRVLNAPTWSAYFGVAALNTTMKQTSVVPLTINNLDPAWGVDYTLHVVAEQVDECVRIVDGVWEGSALPPPGAIATSWTGNFTVESLFLGEALLRVELRRAHMAAEQSAEALHVIIMRNEDGLDLAFKATLGIFVFVMYVSFGAVIDLRDLKRIILRPIGPIIGFLGQFLIMPLLSFGIGYVVFPTMIELRLGLLFTGCTAGGGLSNVITVVLNGNINLSVAMTAISNLAAFGMMPLWIFTLGSVVLEGGEFTIPYKTIAVMSFLLLVPLCLGAVLQRYASNVASKLAKHLQSASLVLVLIIMVFAFIVNSYLFKLFTWRILLACSALPWLGYLLGWAMAKLARQSSTDALTIAIETGIQNTGIAIFMLKVALPQPQADITSAVPIANSVLTPLPLFALYFMRLCLQRRSSDVTSSSDDIECAKVTSTPTPALAELPSKPKAQTLRDRGHDNLAADI